MGDAEGVETATVGTMRGENSETRRSSRSSDEIASVRTSESSIESEERTRKAECNGWQDISKKAMSCRQNPK